MKKRNLLLFLILIFSSISMQVSAQYFGYGWNEGDCKSDKDPLYMEMPDTLHAMIPTNVKIYINDPIVREYAQYIEIQAGNSHTYQTTGPKPSRTSGGAFSETMPYDGEDIIEFGFRPSDRVGLPTSIIVTFYIAKESQVEYPDTHDEESQFYGYNCHREYNSLLCNKEDGCDICNYPIGQVIKHYMMSDTDETVSIPDRVDFVDEKAENGYTAVASQSLSYNAKKKFINTQGYEFETSDIYSITLQTQELWDTFEAYKENDLDGYIGPKDDVKNPDVTVNDISASGPELTGKAYEMVYNGPLNPQNGADFVDIYYQLFAEMAPKGSGVMIVKAARQTVFEKGTGSEAELEAVRNDVLNLLSSYKLSKGKVIGPGDYEYIENNFKWYIRGEPEEEETTDEYYVAGHISDYFDHPMPYMRMVAVIEGKEYEGFTDEDGVYRIRLEGLELKEGEEKDVTLFAMFDYYRNGKNYFDIYFRKPNNQYDSVAAHKKGKLVFGEHLQIDFIMDGGGDFGTSFANKQDIMHYSLIYFNTAEAVEFILNTLKEDMDYKLPVTVYVGNLHKKTLYSPDDSRILISAAGTSLSDSDRPDNREYHEFSHALMYDIYNAWPAGRMEPGNKNHDGFLNNNTGDSYLEGFAEFMAMVISDDMGEPLPTIYAGFGSMEKNYKPWDGRGMDEEFAVASLLWDIYDDRNEKGDSITLSLDDIWKVLKVKRRDFYEYYKAFKTEFPEQSDAFDELFKMHGFFHDTRVGDSVYDPGEPWKYTNAQETQWRFIDLSGNITQTKTIEYQPGFTIGKATNYDRPDRSSAVRIPGAFLKVKDDEVDFYNIKVTHEDSSLDYEYVVERAEEKIYIQPLPLDEDAEITVTPASKDYKAEEVFSINSQDMNELLSSGKDLDGYFAEHEFNLKPTGSKTDEKYLLFDDTEPTYEYEGDLGEEYEIKISKDAKKLTVSESENNSGAAFSFPFGRILFYILLGVFVFFYIKKPKFRKKTNDFAQKVWHLIKKSAKWFMKYGVPAILTFLKWLYNLIVKIIRGIVHHSKKAIEKTKPHVKKAHENIKKKIAENKEKKKKQKKKTEKSKND
ncbi:MAG: hypothetical protein KKF44_07950 [Nanoarchaeota archaeon]|nr:hypothetical protein [Nanoarchaeota archaeon]